MPGQSIGRNHPTDETELFHRATKLAYGIGDILHRDKCHCLKAGTALQVTGMDVVVVARGVGQRPLGVSDVAVGKSRGGIEHGVIRLRLIEKLQPLFRASVWVEGARCARRPISWRVKVVETRHPVARPAVVERRAHKLNQVLCVLHHMTIGINITLRHRASFSREVAASSAKIYSTGRPLESPTNDKIADSVYRAAGFAASSARCGQDD